MSLENIYTLLELNSGQNVSLDMKLELIHANVEKQLKGKLGGVETIPDELSYIVEEVSIIRFNRIGSEGMTTESVEGASATYYTDDFMQYKQDIQDYINRTDSAPVGRVRFI